MSDRINGFYVALERDIKDEDFKAVEKAVKLLKGVIGVKRSVANSTDYYNRTMIRHEIYGKINDVLFEDLSK